MKKYNVRFLINDIYEVVELIYDINYEVVDEISVYKGGLADCEAYIRLKEGGYM